ncbi:MULTISPECIES: FadR/GntR family transcriptional regulator [Oceanobacillus]|uniref:FadR/GntR family transcriptional regulator n=1 Tax=Oceanobacillus TaxID=182709 RepID=UPI00084E535B|nr:MULTISPECIES: FadR/GntR family transcriptional regulator [Oceanobacillus]MBT2600224.1 FadR family transcriptional regulator [Oceanobacillus sp. ISL-74]MBT2650382.1 FadR family transcriptional regulator [Oceanobacillus sp. ISL-73]OEH55066.1 transcriptional regulator [Oceanobacillus sp. E9]
MSKKISATVTEYIVQQLKNGRYKIGDKLPSEREFMELLHVGRSSIRESLNTLEDMGVVEKRMGIGVFVKQLRVNQLADAYVVASLLDNHCSRELLDFRFILEVEMAGRAACFASKQDLIQMEEAIYLHQKAIDQKTSFIQADELFHQAIIVASNNHVIKHVYQSLHDLVQDTLYQKWDTVDSDKCFEEHVKIYEAIKTHQETNAKQMMMEHLHAHWATPSNFESLH